MLSGRCAIAPGWVSLHRVAWSLDDWSKIEGWFKEWESVSVPCGVCWKHWESFKKNDNPNFSSRESFFWWSFRAHNEVSLRIQKDVWSAEEFVCAYAFD